MSDVTTIPATAPEARASWRDNVPFILMIVVTAGFFALLGMMSFHAVPSENKDMLNTAVGMVASGWVAAMGYFYGSTSSSRTKDAAIASLATQPKNGATP